MSARFFGELVLVASGLKLLDPPFLNTHVKGPDVLNPVDETAVSTNSVNQWGLAAIECLGLVCDQMPVQAPK